MTGSEINAQLYRPIASGDQYDGFFPYSTCETTKLAKGNTKVAINQMAKWARTYAYHAEDIAEVLDTGDLTRTVDNVQDFLYNHFQYKIDETDQLLRSPGCAWSQRAVGIDCKSYSIIASSILLVLGVKHYLRRIKQHIMPEVYSHVYVVIPMDQQTGKLNGDYLVIDGTVKENIEIPFLKSDDKLMTEPKLPIYGLAAQLGCGCATPQGMGLTTLIDGDAPQEEDQGIDLKWFEETFGSVTDFLGNIIVNKFDISCFNSAFKPSGTGADIEQNHIPVLEMMVAEISNNNTAFAIEQALNAFARYLANNYQYFYTLRHINNWNSCSRSGLNNYVVLYEQQLAQLPTLIDSVAKFYTVDAVAVSAPVERPIVFGKETENGAGIGDDVEANNTYQYQNYALTGSGTGGSNNTPDKAGDSTAVMIGVGVVAFGAYIYSKSKSK